MATKKIATKTTASTPTPVEKTTTPIAKKAAKKATAKKAAPAAVKKETTPAAANKVAAPVAAKKIAAVKPSLDVIARAAYLNYRRRVEQGLPGNSQGDWLEAERQFAK